MTDGCLWLLLWNWLYGSCFRRSLNRRLLKSVIEKCELNLIFFIFLWLIKGEDETTIENIVPTHSHIFRTLFFDYSRIHHWLLLFPPLSKVKRLIYNFIEALHQKNKLY